MIMHIRANYPGHRTKEVIQVFTSPKLPPRPEFVKELGSTVYSDSEGFHSVFLLELPDNKAAEVASSQRIRQTFMMSRVEGLTIEAHFGVSVAEGIPEIMPYV